MSRVIVIGLGPIGQACAAAVCEHPQLELAGLVDVAPEKVGQPAGDLLANFLVPGVTVPAVNAVGDLAHAHEADVAIITTTSRFAGVAPTLREAIEKRLHVVSTCEEMLWPRYREAALSDTLDAEAKAAGVALLGTGVNPGFVMDLLPVVLSSMLTRVHKVRAVRRVNAATRRGPLQAKVGATMTEAAFRERKAAGTIGHKGLMESLALLAAGLGFDVKPGSITEQLEPVIADRQIESGLGTIQPGQVCGIHNTGTWQTEGLSIELDLIMQVGYEEPYDAVELEGPHPLTLTIPGGTPGDTATVAAVINQVRQIAHARPGLRTMLDVGPAGAFGYKR